MAAALLEDHFMAHDNTNTPDDLIDPLVIADMRARAEAALSEHTLPLRIAAESGTLLMEEVPVSTFAPEDWMDLSKGPCPVSSIPRVQLLEETFYMQARGHLLHADTQLGIANLQQQLRDHQAWISEQITQQGGKFLESMLEMFRESATAIGRDTSLAVDAAKQEILAELSNVADDLEANQRATHESQATMQWVTVAAALGAAAVGAMCLGGITTLLWRSREDGQSGGRGDYVAYDDDLYMEVTGGFDRTRRGIQELGNRLSRLESAVAPAAHYTQAPPYGHPQQARYVAAHPAGAPAPAPQAPAYGYPAPAYGYPAPAYGYPAPAPAHPVYGVPGPYPAYGYPAPASGPAGMSGLSVE